MLTELDDRLPGDAMVSVDCGTVPAWFARHLHVRPGMLASLSVVLVLNPRPRRLLTPATLL